MEETMPPRTGLSPKAIDYTDGWRHGYAAAKRTADPVAPLLISYPDIDGSPVYFDPALVTGLRERVEPSRKVWTTLVFIGVSGGTTQIFTVMERAEVVGERINMYRRGLGAQVDAAVAERKVEQGVTGINYFVQEDASNAAAFEAERQSEGEVN